MVAQMNDPLTQLSDLQETLSELRSLTADESPSQSSGKSETTALTGDVDSQDAGDLSDIDRQPIQGDVAALAEMRNPSEIARVEESGEAVRYQRVMLLAPGRWTDAGSQQTLEYPAEAIKQSADNWLDNEVNLLHAPGLHDDPVMGDIGEVDTDSIIVDDRGAMYGDIVLHGDTPASKVGIESMDRALDTDGREGIDGPSVEITEDETELDRDRGLERMQEMWFSGVGLVYNPASKPVDLRQQVRERGVAMSEGDGRLMLRDKDDDRPATAMSNSKIEQRLDEFDQRLSELQRTLSDETSLQEGAEEFGIQVDKVQEEMAEEMQQRASGDMSEDEARAEIVSEVAEASGRDESTINAIIDGEADSVPDGVASAFAEVLNVDLEDIGGEPPEDEQSDEDGEGGSGDEQNMSAELDAAVETIGEITDRLESIDSMLTSVEERQQDLQDQQEDLDRRLAGIEDEPQRRALAEHPNSDGDGSESSADDGSGGSGGVVREGGYIGR